MSMPANRLLASLAIAVALLVPLAGFVAGSLSETATNAAGEDAPVAGGEISARDLLATLGTIAAHNHWGNWQPPDAATDTDAAEALPMRATDAGVIGRNFRLVGIEGRGRAQLALLLPLGNGAEVIDGSRDLIRLQVGDTLMQDVTLETVGGNTASFRNSDGTTTTLQLYESIP
jgi:hypothetical protein